MGGVIIMRTQVMVVSSVVGFLGLVVVILGVAGENATAQALVPDSIIADCVYRTTPALACGIVAALLALTAQVAVTAASLCFGCCRTWELPKPKETRRIVGIVLSAISWIFVIIVFALFIAGAAMNSEHERQLTTADQTCPVDPGSAMFAAATVFSLVATVSQIASYVLLLATPKGSTKPLATEQPELAMGQPVKQQDAEDAEEAVAAGAAPPPPSAPPLSQDTEPTSQV